MTTKSRAKLCMKVAEKDPSNLQSVFDVAQDLNGDQENKSEASEGSDRNAADVFANRKDLGPPETEERPSDLGC
eukprot:10148848-Lingulodinium_polyedra.AAC.1